MFSFDLEAFQGMPLPSQCDIMSTWVGDLQRPVVSIVCMVFNQQQYFHDAMRGFLMQRTDFPFEIIVHDDASTDGTTAILEDYQKRYPGIVKTIIQTENQYSRFPSSVALFPAKMAKGEYIALCEGDDFWTDSGKLQLQINAMRRRPDIDLCFHRSIEMLCDREGQPCLLTNEREGDTECVVPLTRIIREGGGMIKTAPIVLRRSVFERLPEWYRQCPVFDYTLKILACQPAGALYLPHTMSVYRIAAQGSWTAGLEAKYEKFVQNQDLSLQRLEDYVRPEYKKLVRAARSRLAMSASGFHLRNRNRRKCKEMAIKSLRLAGRIKTQAIRNILFCWNGTVFKVVCAVRFRLRREMAT